MKKSSLWLEDIPKKEKIRKLKKDIAVDILIIGGGMTGLNVAYQLRRRKGKVVVVEQNRIGYGASGRCLGKINYLQGTIYNDLEDEYSIDVASKYLDSQLKAIRTLKRIIVKEKIDCDFCKVKSIVTVSNKKDEYRLKRLRDTLIRLKIDFKEHRKNKSLFNYWYGISVNDTYIFNPVKYMYKLKDIIKKNGIDIYEYTRINSIRKKNGIYICKTDNNVIEAKKVIVCSKNPYFFKPYKIPFNCYIDKSYICGVNTSQYKKEIIDICDINETKRYYKNKKYYLLYSSNNHNICNNLNEKKNQKMVLAKLKKKVNYYWSNDDLMTVDKMPYIGRLEKSNDNLLVATGYNKWGITNSVIASLIIKDIIYNKDNEFIELFDPLRVSLKNIDEVLYNVGSNLKSFIDSKLIKNKMWYSNNVRYGQLDGKNVAIYDDGKIRHIVYSDCPHMKCTLLFNEVEKIWECPCHASKFRIDGKCIYGPSVKDITYINENEN